MSRRVNLPAADDLFRPTSDDSSERSARPAADKAVRVVPDEPAADAEESAGGRRKPSGRVRHDEKMTVYVTSDELLDLEHTRLALRRSHGMAVDRGRLVREALALVLADFEEHGADSVLVRRLIQE